MQLSPMRQGKNKTAACKGNSVGDQESWSRKLSESRTKSGPDSAQVNPDWQHSSLERSPVSWERNPQAGKQESIRASQTAFNYSCFYNTTSGGNVTDVFLLLCCYSCWRSCKIKWTHQLKRQQPTQPSSPAHRSEAAAWAMLPPLSPAPSPAPLGALRAPKFSFSCFLGTASVEEVSLPLPTSLLPCKHKLMWVKSCS